MCQKSALYCQLTCLFALYGTLWTPLPSPLAAIPVHIRLSNIVCFSETHIFESSLVNFKPCLQWTTTCVCSTFWDDRSGSTTSLSSIPLSTSHCVSWSWTASDRARTTHSHSRYSPVLEIWKQIHECPSYPQLCLLIVKLSLTLGLPVFRKLQAVLRIRDVYPGCEFFSSPDRYRIRIKDFKYLNPKIVSRLSEIRSGLFIPDPDPDFLPSRIPDPGVKKAPDPGSVSATLVGSY
jgi:hypothetical protein